MLKDMEYIAVDLETSGAYPVRDQICEVGLAKVKNGKVIESYQSLVNPGLQMTPEIIKIHNITNEMVKDSPKISEIINKVYDFIKGYPVIAHHAPFDVGFLSYEFEKIGLALPHTPVFCTSILSISLIPETENHKLATLVEFLKIDRQSAHRAYDDAVACSLVFEECLKRFGNEKSIKNLREKQKKNLSWHRYSINDLKELLLFAPIIEAIETSKKINLVYRGGSMSGLKRVVEPLGIVRSPNGDYFVAKDVITESQNNVDAKDVITESQNNEDAKKTAEEVVAKRFYLNKVRETELIN